jgi:archaellum component FlaF (FlaF/FlaG flagellin family)
VLFRSTGKAITHANTFFKIRKRKPKVAEFVADATAEHVKITCDGVIVPTTAFDASNNDNGSTTLEATGTFDGTNLPFVVNSASVLT